MPHKGKGTYKTIGRPSKKRKDAAKRAHKSKKK